MIFQGKLLVIMFYKREKELGVSERDLKGYAIGFEDGKGPKWRTVKTFLGGKGKKEGFPQPASDQYQNLFQRLFLVNIKY